MINQLIAAEADHLLLNKLHHYATPDLLVCDELGYLSLGQQGSHLFFQVISQRHQRKSTVMTTNVPFAEWGKVCDSTTVATAIADRLVHNLAMLLKQQRGRCAYCGLFFHDDDRGEIDHISGDRRHARTTNLQALHGHCHNAKTREHGDYLPHGMRDQPQDTKERSARKRARSVLEQREVERSASRL